MQEFKVVLLGYRSLTGLVSQSGTDAPTMVILENNLKGTPVWTRDAQGEYTLTLAGAFTVGKTFVMCPSITSQGATTIISANSNPDIINLGTSDAAEILQDGLLYENTIEIRVYN